MNRELSVSRVPPPPGPEIWIRRLRAREVLRCTILSTEMWGVQFHWTGKVSAPHFVPTEQCAGCQAQQPLKWRGYLHIVNQDKMVSEFLELSPALVRAVETATGLTGGWRGLRMRFERGAGDRAKVSCSLQGPDRSVEPLPAERDPLRELSLLWGLSVSHTIEVERDML